MKNFVTYVISYSATGYPSILERPILCYLQVTKIKSIEILIHSELIEGHRLKQSSHVKSIKGHEKLPLLMDYLHLHHWLPKIHIGYESYESLLQVFHTRFLGITIDSQLNWQKHCNNIINMICILDRARRLLKLLQPCIIH